MKKLTFVCVILLALSACNNSHDMDSYLENHTRAQNTLCPRNNPNCIGTHNATGDCVLNSNCNSANCTDPTHNHNICTNGVNCNATNHQHGNNGQHNNNCTTGSQHHSKTGHHGK